MGKTLCEIRFKAPYVVGEPEWEEEPSQGAPVAQDSHRVWKFKFEPSFLGGYEGGLFVCKAGEYNILYLIAY